jgi:A/G-specific adenine glycosylase
VLVSEILLAKTRAEDASRVVRRVLETYPTPHALAAADKRTVERMLYPLGLHRLRAMRLISCAAELVANHDGVVPRSVVELRALPLVGRYAANAIASVAFGRRLPIVDVNVARVYGRVFSLPRPRGRLDTAHALWTFAGKLLPRRRAKQYNWALLDLGGTICTARKPACDRCPIASLCDAFWSRNVDSG